MLERKIGQLVGDDSDDELEATQEEERRQRRKRVLEPLKRFMGKPAGWITLIATIAILGAILV